MAHQSRWLRMGALLLVQFWLGNSAASGAGLTVHVRQGQDAANDVRARTFAIPVVEIRDANDQPVADAEVTFELPGAGPGGSFHGWMRAQTLRSDSRGMAKASGFSPNHETGHFEIRVAAVSGSRSGAATIVQTNGPAAASTANRSARARNAKMLRVLMSAIAAQTAAVVAVSLKRNPGSKAGWLAAASSAGTVLVLASALRRRPKKQNDQFITAGGPVKITPLRHATLMIDSPDGRIYVDPTPEALGTEKRADLVLITDAYGDHFDAAILPRILKSGGVVYAPEAAAGAAPGSLAIRNGEQRSWRRWQIEATPAYNVPRSVARARVFHEKGMGNGYVLGFGGKRFYVSGNTGDTPEMRGLRDIDVAFLCMSPPYTMSAKEAAEAARAFQPKVAFPYHYVGSLLSVYQFKKGLEGAPIDVRIRNWYP